MRGKAPLSVDKVILKITDIGVAIGVCITALTALLTINKGPNVFVTLSIALSQKHI